MRGDHPPDQDEDRAKLTWWETLGAWLRIWTPPRDATVPPVPRRPAAIAAVGVGVVIAATVVLVAPSLRTSKERHARAEARDVAARKAAERTRVRAEQQLHTAHSRGVSRSAVLRDLERAIARDTRQRVRRGLLDGPVLNVVCRTYPGARRAHDPTGRYACTAVQRRIVSPQGPVEIGHPFWAKVDFARRRLAWCKVNPRPGERTIGMEFVFVPLPHGCDLDYSGGGSDD